MILSRYSTSEFLIIFIRKKWKEAKSKTKIYVYPTGHSIFCYENSLCELCDGWSKFTCK